MGVFLHAAVKKTQLGNIFTSLGRRLMSNASPVRQTMILPEDARQWKNTQGGF